MTALAPFRIAIDDDRLTLLEHRLESIMWPNVPSGVPGHGIEVDRVRGLVEHWRQRFDWRAFEASLNELDQVLHDDGTYPLHLVHHRAEDGEGVPIVLLHGWPDTFLRYRKLIPLLAAAGHDVIVPSLPGFAFSGQSDQPHTTAVAAERVHAALQALGVTHYALHGGDFGSVVADELIQLYPAEIVAIHLTDVPFTKQFTADRSTFSPAEREFAARSDEWSETATYFTVQAAQPLTLAYGLTDSPVGLLAWFADKFDTWSDTVDPDDIVGLTAMTWLTGTAWSGMRLYGDDTDQDWSDEVDPWTASADHEPRADPATDAEQTRESAEGPDLPDVPAAFSIFPKDIACPRGSTASASTTWSASALTTTAATSPPQNAPT